MSAPSSCNHHRKDPYPRRIAPRFYTTVDFVIAATPSGARAAKDGSPTILRRSRRTELMNRESLQFNLNRKDATSKRPLATLSLLQQNESPIEIFLRDVVVVARLVARISFQRLAIGSDRLIETRRPTPALP